MPKCVKTISVDAMHLFEINFDVAALLIFIELVCGSCGAAWGPILSLKTRLLKELMLIRMDLSTEQCGLTHMLFTSSFNT